MIHLTRRLPSLLLLLPFAASLTAPLAAQESRSVEIDHLEERLQYLADDYQSELVSNNIPGMAVAVVQDDKIIFARGFGLADMQSGRKVTPETRFAIGSTSKAFTTALVGMLVDEAQMDWDAPITDYLPYFELNIDSKKEADQATLRDLLSHRTGFTRMGLLWASGLTTREESLRAATQAEPWSRFRRKFFYNNVMYLAAGVAAGKLSGLGWDEMVKQRIFTPLGMHTTTTTYAAAIADKGMALGYKWQEDLGRHMRDPMRNIDLIGPAGSINSNVLEMGNWLRFLIARGEFEGQRLISEAALTDTWEPNIRIGGEIKYGMGWMMNKYQGQKALHHGGNIDGFSAAVALLPESNLGYVMLTNIGSTPLQAPTSTLVWDALLADFEVREEKAAPIEGEFDGLLGIYMANFGSFKDGEFTVSTRNGALFVDIPGQINGELLAPDENGDRTMKLAPVLKFRFVQNEAGQVERLELRQGGASFEMYKQGHVFEFDLPLEELEGFLGNYADSRFKSPLVVKIQNGHLAVDVPGQMVFELNLPNDEGIWSFRAIEGLGIEFEYDDDDQVVALINHQNGTTARSERMQESDKEGSISDLPSMAEIDELRGLAAHLAARKLLGTVRHRASINLVHSGIKGSLEEIEALDGRFWQHTLMGKFGYADIAFDGTKGWSNSSFDVYEEPEGLMLDQLMLVPMLTYLGDWSQHFDKRRVLRAAKIEGADHWVIELTKGALPPITLYIHQETGDLTRAKSNAISGGSGARVPVQASFGDYHEVNGLRLPHLVRSENDSAGATVMIYEGMEVNLETTKDMFQKRN